MIPLHATITGFSRAMFSNWLWYKPLDLIIDAGEGLQLALGPRLWSPNVVALTHAHSDHILGLPGFVASRRYGKGAPDKPLTVIYPDGCSGVDAIKELFARLWARETFPVTWVAAVDGTTLPMGRQHTLEAFASRHGTAEPTLAYRVVETRKRLRPEFAGLEQATIRELVQRQGRESVMEPIRHITFAHSGDSMPLAVEAVRHADLLVHDATFLEPGDRRWDIHAASQEVLALAREAEVRCLVLHHLSIRYERADALPTLKAQVVASGFTGECWLLDDGRLIALQQPE